MTARTTGRDSLSRDPRGRRTVMMRGARSLAVATVLGAALVAYAAIGGGELRATPGIAAITVTSATGTTAGSVTLENTTASTALNVLVGSDATCDPGITFAVPAGNPIASFAAGSTRDVQITCPPRDTAAMLRCRYHATDTLSGVALASFWGVCLYGASPPTLTPLQTTLEFGSVAIGELTQQTLSIRNDGSGPALTRVYLQTTDADGTFQFATPCSRDAAFCDEDLPAAIAPGDTLDIGVRCRPQAPGERTSSLLIGTDTFQLLSTAVTLRCTGVATTAPALAIEPTTITVPSPVEVAGEGTRAVVHLANAGGGILTIRDIRVVEVDPGAADDWRYTATGTCSGQISSTCTLASGAQVDLELTFSPTAIGARRATLLISYRDTLDRTLEVPLDGVGRGATLRRTETSTLNFGAVPIGKTATLEVLVHNDGNRAADVTLTLSPGTAPPFSAAPAGATTVEPAAPRTLTLGCAPTTAGTFATTLTLDGDGSLSPAPLAINAICEGTSQQLHATPPSQMLGELRAGAVARTVSVRLDTVDPGATVTLDGPPRLEPANANLSLGPLSQSTTPATFDLTVTPQSTGGIASSVVLTTTSGETLRIPIDGRVVEVSYQVSPMLDLGTFCVDQPTTSSSATLVSDGTATIELRAPALSLAPSPFQLSYVRPPRYPYPLGPNQSASVSLTPHRQRAAGTVTDTLTWRTDVTGPQATTTALTARFIDSGGAIAPTALGFGEVTVHLFTDNGQRVVIQNCNPTPLVLDPPMIRAPFSIDSPGFPTLLNPNERVSFSVGFHPTRKGTVTDVLRITSPQLSGAPLEVTLTGTGGPLDPTTPDAGVEPPTSPGDGCGCRSARPASGLALAMMLVLALRPRRRARRSARR